jgi:serine/threonine protein kinase
MEVVSELKYDEIRQIGIGQGMNSVVHLARDKMNRTVAVKAIPHALLQQQGVLDYFQEAKALYQSRHTNVVEVYAVSETPAAVLVMMPYYQDGSLSDRIATNPLPLAELLRVGQGILQGLSAIHVAGYVHFDVKPSNVLFS